MAQQTLNINLDKICAEFGMDLLSLPNRLYIKSCEVIKNSNNKDEFLNLDYAVNEFEKKLEDFFKDNLIDPLKNLKDKIRKADDQEEVYNKLKREPPKLPAKDYETEITKALGILIEDGPFAYLIWLKSEDKEPHRAMLIQTARILQKLNLIGNINTEDDLKEEIETSFLNEITSDLTKTLFTKTILEKMLIYARYKAKAMQHE